MRVVIPACIAFLVGAAPVAAQNLQEYGTAGDWGILVDPAAGPGCLMQRMYDSGTLVQIGALPLRDGAFLAAYNAEWTQISEGEEGVVTLDFGDALFEGEVVGDIENDLPGGLAFFDNPDFVSEFAKRNTLKLSTKGGKGVEVDLRGSSNALNAVRACQDKQPTATN